MDYEKETYRNGILLKIECHLKIDNIVSNLVIQYTKLPEGNGYKEWIWSNEIWLDNTGHCIKNIDIANFNNTLKEVA